MTPEPLDFPGLLRARGLWPDFAAAAGVRADAPLTQATTILAFKFAGGVLVAGDRRATAGNVLVYDRADKVLEVDPRTVMAIAGSPAAAWEMARVLRHSFQFYRRTQLQEMSVAAKVRALSKLLRDNFGMALQGVGAVVPLLVTAEPGGGSEAQLFFYDVMGAQFEAADYATLGSGSPALRGVFYYENTYGPRPLRERPRAEALALALRALDTAAESDTATGGLDPRGRIHPVVRIVSPAGVETVPDAELAAVKTERMEDGE